MGTPLILHGGVLRKAYRPTDLEAWVRHALA
jgi:hypothetical protein